MMELFSTHVKNKAKDGTMAMKETDVAEVEAKQEIPVSETLLENNDIPSGNNNPQKSKSHSKKGRRDVAKTAAVMDIDNEVCRPEWVNGEPQGTEAFIVEGSDGLRRSIIVPDSRLPAGWQKHFTQRKTGSSAGKWDVFFVHDSSSKKFRSRNEIKSYMENIGQFDYDPERFDFCIHRNKRSASGPRIKPDVKKIKTLLPKNKPSGVMDSSSAGAGFNTSTPADDNVVVFIGGLRVEMQDSAYKCPKEGCNKNFRKENLLQMHIKHYHPEYSKFFGSTPNVADLAYARTIGESIDDIIPKKSSNFLDRINKLDKRKEKAQGPPLQPTPSAMPDQSLLLSAPFPTGQSVLGMNAVDNSLIDKSEIAAISPGSAFQMKSKEEKSHSGIKTLLPVRSADLKREICSLDEPKKRRCSEHVFTSKAKKRPAAVQDLADEPQDLDDGALDTDKSSSFSYRFSHRKFDAKSNENGENSQLNEISLDNGGVPKGKFTERDSNNDTKEDGMMTMINGELVKLERLRREEIINCTCGVMEEDGLMIQCDVCLCWQHGHCYGVERENEVPEKYICFICRYPYRQRPSKQYSHDQEWIKEGKLPSALDRKKNQAKIEQRTAMLKRSYDLVAVLLQIQDVLYSLRVKINVAEKKDHPKLYLWAKNWAKVVIPKIDMEPIPVYEYTKAKPKNAEEPDGEEFQNQDIKFEQARGVKDDGNVDEKSIASYTELVKILEDNSRSEESKITCQSEDEGQSSGNILLDALTKNGANQTHEFKSENESSSFSQVDFDAQISVPSFIPEPEAPIDLEECRLRLLEHIDHFQNHIDTRLTAIETQVSYLEGMDLNLAPERDLPPRIKQTVQMLLRDLSTVRKLAALC